ncbi:MAG TPA: APC family permease [Streptosporangiaceae bacterium]|nr:APC family permease [Streptosporangiaceae bacterium]
MTDHSEALDSPAAQVTESAGGRYHQQLNRSIGILGNVFITLSGVTPASSVFIIAPVALVAAGSGSFLAFVFAAIVGVFMAFCWAELSAAYPIAGGDYALVWHSFKGRSSWLAGPLSFVTFALYVDFIAFIPAVIALGMGTYLAVIVSVNAKVLGAIVMLVAAGIAILNIRLNAVITGIFLAIELAALAAVTVLGFAHAHHASVLLHPVTGGTHGSLQFVSFTAVLALTAVAVFSYNGYANAVNFSEETTGPSRTIARAILWSLVITVAAELIPITAVILGSPSIAKLSESAVPMQYFIDATSNSTVNTIISIGVVIAILNAVIAIVLGYARIFFSSGRDRAWPGPVNGWMTAVNRFKSPWFPTALVGVLGAIMCLTVSLDTLVNLTGASLVADYALIALGALFARPTGATANSPYKMPLWPLPPILALASLGYVFTEQTGLLLKVTLITVAIGLLYWAVVILPQKGRAWNLREAAIDEEHPA